MGKFYSEEDITWSSIEKYIPYAKVNWEVDKNGIPRYNLFDENGKKIDIDKYVKRHISLEKNS